MNLLAGLPPILEFAITLAINAVLITFLFPKLKGFSFTGNYGHGLLYALCLEIASFIIGILAMALVIATLGLAAFPLAFFLIFGFWLLNAIYLKVLAHFMPEHLSINGWTPAIIAGLIMMVVGMILGDGSFSVSINQPTP